jgi:ribosomal protein S18 acetylase RimI-like enzyme
MFSQNHLATSALAMRPANAKDAAFLQQLYRATRTDLLQLDLGSAQAEALVAQQYEVLQAGTAEEFPHAMHFVVEKTASRVGAVIVDFGPAEVRLVYLALLPAVRGQGHGQQLVRGLQQAAERAGAPLAVTVWRSNPHARALYLALGFVVEQALPVAERMVWYPPTRPMVVMP